MSNHIHLLLLLLFSLISSLTCTLDVAGGSSDHGNANVGGVISDSLNSGVADVSVRLLPADFNPAADDFNPDSLTAVTDSAGFYKIENVPWGTYCLNGTGPDSVLKTYKNPVTIDTSDIYTLHATLALPGTIKIPVDTTLWVFDNSITVFIPGTNIYSTAISLNDTIKLNRVPIGIHTVCMYSAIHDSIIAVDEEFSSFQVMSGFVKDFTIYPEKPRGPATGVINSEYQFNSIFKYTGWISNIAVQFIEYRFAWGDADTSDWSAELSAKHSWSFASTFKIRAQMRYIPNQITQEFYNTQFCSGWSESGFIVLSDK